MTLEQAANILDRAWHGEISFTGETPFAMLWALTMAARWAEDNDEHAPASEIEAANVWRSHRSPRGEDQMAEATRLSELWHDARTHCRDWRVRAVNEYMVT